MKILLFVFLSFILVFGSPVRFLGMGSLRVLVEGETNQINLYDFGRIGAGFLSDGDLSYVEAYGSLYEGDGFSGIGDPFATRVVRFSNPSATVEEKDFFHSISIPPLFSHLSFSRRESSGFSVGFHSSLFSHHEKIDTKGIEFLYCEPMTFPFHWAVTGYGLHHSKHLFAFGGGGSVSLFLPIMDLGMRFHCHRPSWDSGNGYVFDGGLSGTFWILGLIKAGFRAEKVMGRVETRDVNDSELNARFLIAPPVSPLIAAGSVCYQGNDTYGLRLGVGVRIPVLLVGAEFLYTDTISSQGIEKALNLGTEFGLREFIVLRAGYVVQKGQDVVTAGVGLELENRFHADLALEKGEKDLTLFALYIRGYF